MAPSAVNNGARALEGILARYFEDTNGSVISSGTDTITLAAKQTISAYAQDLVFIFEAGGTNTGAVTLNVDSIGAKAIVKHHDVALAAGDIESGQIVMVVYEATGDNFQMLSQLGNAPSAGLSNVVEDTTPQLGGPLDPNGTFIGMEKGGDIASASPLVVDTDGDYFDVTGTTGFAAMTVAANRHFFLQFDGALTLTHHATNLDLPGEANITTAAGDVGEFFSTGANTVQCVAYTKATGKAVVESVTSDTNTKEFFVLIAGGVIIPDPYEQTFGDFTVRRINSTEKVSFNFFIPADFTTLVSAELVTIPDATETINWNVTTDFGAAGEAYNANSDSVTSSTSATASQLLESDLSAALTGLAASDYVGLIFHSDTTLIRIVGLRIKYS